MIIKLQPVTDENREDILALSVREDQNFVAANSVSLRQADEANAEQPGIARPFGIYADEKLVGFCMFVFDPENEDEDEGNHSSGPSSEDEDGHSELEDHSSSSWSSRDSSDSNSSWVWFTT